jgi:hypothetical protein
VSETPRRFWHITFWTAEGIEYRRYVKCPYLVETEDPNSHGGGKYRRPLVPGDEDYPDTMIAMAADLGGLEWDNLIRSYRLTPVPPERIGKIRDKATRWRDVRKLVAA